MTRARDPFGNALSALRTKLRNGGFAAGSPLVAAELATALAVSITPVREALAHLAGEGLIEERRGRGYFAHRLEMAELEGLYRLHGAYIDAALEEQAQRLALPSSDINRPRTTAVGRDALWIRMATETFFATVVKGGDNRPLMMAHQQVTDRLAAPRLHEAVVFDDLGAELDSLVEALDGGNLETSRAAVRAYHARRLASAKPLAAHLQEVSGANSRAHGLGMDSAP
jgi:DNA-binding GntR family transcriptional regulator